MSAPCGSCLSVKSRFQRWEIALAGWEIGCCAPWEVARQAGLGGTECCRPQCGVQATWKSNDVRSFQAHALRAENDYTELRLSEDKFQSTLRLLGRVPTAREVAASRLGSRPASRAGKSGAVRPVKSPAGCFSGGLPGSGGRLRQPPLQCLGGVFHPRWLRFIHLGSVYDVSGMPFPGFVGEVAATSRGLRFLPYRPAGRLHRHGVPTSQVRRTDFPGAAGADFTRRRRSFRPRASRGIVRRGLP